jgi:hypothetical protein
MFVTSTPVSLQTCTTNTILAHSLANAVLQTAWAGASWARAGELVRYTTTDLWADADIKNFETMLQTVYLPQCKNGASQISNWDLACLNTAIGIAVFLEDSTAYNNAMNLFQEAVPSAIYMEADGQRPHAARGHTSVKGDWFGQQTWGNPGQSGMMQETCRDLTHSGYSISSISHILETSRIQGKDLYETDTGKRLQAGLEFLTKYALGIKPPTWLCQGKPLQRVLEFVTEIGYNAFATREGLTMNETLAYTLKSRPEGTNSLFYGWETLTHAGNKA